MSVQSPIDSSSSGSDEGEVPQPMARILALDVGKKRIGLAISDELGITAQGLPTLHRKRIRDDLKQLGEIARDRQAGMLLIGNPLHMSGHESRQGEYTREFAERLRMGTNLPMVFWDERLTSMEAAQLLRQRGATLDRRTGAVDRMAAILLLDSYLQHLQNQRFAEDQPA